MLQPNENEIHFALIVTGIGIVRSLVLAVGAWMELRAIAGVGDDLLAATRVTDIADSRTAAPNNANIFRSVFRDWM